MTRRCHSWGLLIGLVASSVFAGDITSDKPLSFVRDVRPILQQHCQGCHQPAKPLGGYDVTRPDARTLGGESEQPAIVPGKPEHSYLLQQITPTDGVAEMPKNGRPLSEDEIECVHRWIVQGAVDDSPVETAQFDNDHPPHYTRPPVITSLDFSPAGEWLAVAGYHEVFLHRPDGSTSGNPSGRLIGLSERIESVRFSPDGSLLAVTGGSPGKMGEVQVWDPATQELILSLPVTFDTVFGASWSPDGELLAFGGTDHTVRVVKARTGEQVLFQAAHSDWVLDTVFSADGSHLASVGRDATAKLIEVATERFVDNITSITPGALRGGIHAVARHPQRDEILFGGADGVPRIYRMHRTVKRVIGDDANLLWELPPIPGRLFDVDYSCDGRVLAAVSSLDGSGGLGIYGIDPAAAIPDDIVAILTKPTHERTSEERTRLADHFRAGVRVIGQLAFDDGGLYAVAINPSATRVAAAGANGNIRLVDTASGNVVETFTAIDVDPAADDGTSLAASPREVPAAPSVRESLPTSETLDVPQRGQLEQLLIQPRAIQLRGASDYVQLIVLAEYSHGEQIDVTRSTTFQAVGCCAISPFGRVSPQQDGTAILTATFAGKTAEVPVEVSGLLVSPQPDYVRDVAPILARAGCNTGTCHGAQDGKNGFKLSLRGYDPLFDVRALTDDHASRRTNLVSPADSLWLLKPTGEVPHEGGVVIPAGSDYYHTLLAWVQSGAHLRLGGPQVTEIAVQPLNPIISSPGTRHQMRVTATYSDGSRRDVTREAFIESGDAEIVRNVDEHAGLIEVLRRGEAPLLVRYQGHYAATTVTVLGDRDGFTWQQPPVNNRIDELVGAKLARTKTDVSPLCDDFTFVRRLYLDLTGLPPSPSQIEAFITNPRDSRWKRELLIDELIGSPAYVEHWTNKWADLLQVNGKFLGRAGAASFRDWIRGEVRANTPYDQLVRKLLTAEGSNREHPAASYFKILREPAAIMENTTQLFLATRFNCNKCHDHPFERWTQDQYYALAAFFAEVALQPDPASGGETVAGTAVEAAKPLYEIVTMNPAARVTHLRTAEPVTPSFPFECDYASASDATARQRLAAWISSPDNPYFAKSYANRIWAYLTGRGLIEPIDDIRAGNPPSNPELLEWLTAEFIDSDFDARHLIRIICRSRTYQLALEPTTWNSTDHLNYSHGRARRLPAEVLYDAIYQVTGAVSAIPGVPAGTRAAALPDVGITLPDGFLNNLGRPVRESACECERSNELQMGPVMALINGATVGEALAQPGNALHGILEEETDDRRVIEQMILRILNRPAQAVEIDDALQASEAIRLDHQRLVAEFERYERDLQPRLEMREAERVATLAEKKDALARHRAESAPERARLAEARQAKIDAAAERVASLRAELLKQLEAWEDAARSATHWETLRPVELASDIGEELTLQADGSIFATGALGKTGANQFTAVMELTGLTGVRLEALPDDRLPQKGPGRAGDGNFVLTELRLWLLPAATDVPASAEESSLVRLVNAQADFSQDGFPIAHAIDGQTEGDGNGWAISPQIGRAHTATFEIARDRELTGPGRVRVQMIQHYSSGEHRLGRFRIAVTRTPGALQEGLPGDLSDIVHRERAERTAEQQALLEDHYLQFQPGFAEATAAWQAAQADLPPDPLVEQLEQRIAELSQPLPADPEFVRLQRAVSLSREQLSHRRLTFAQDLAWALINSPEFLYNH